MNSASSSFWQRLNDWLGWKGWAGVGVIVAAALSLAGFFIASGGSSNSSQINSVHGSCNAAGNGNTVSCTQSSSGTNP